ncbi:MAG: magnesium transporter [Acidobacteria bacterium]|nr:magnesium transporter [Acidobacteriota bacterium]
MTASTAVLTPVELRDAWSLLLPAERLEGFRLLERADADEFFLELSAADQAQLLESMPAAERRLWMRVLPPDDAADLIQTVEEADRRAELLALLDEVARHEVSALLVYAEDVAGGLMSTRFARLRPEMTVEEAVRYLRRQAQEQLETIYNAYVVDTGQRLVGVVSFRDLFRAPGDRALSDVMERDVISVPEDLDEEGVARIIAQHNLQAVPVVDREGRIKGIVTVDDIIDVVRNAATEDIQKVGGMEALGTPYLGTGLPAMVKKRAGWLSALFIGEMLTASAMGHFEEEIAKAVVLALFVPLIISSGGNSGGQATTLVIRAMALGEVGLKDWWRVIRREAMAGLALGALLAVIGFVRIAVWEGLFHTYGPHYLLIATTVSISLVGVVLWGTIAGSMLPFLIRRLGFDPASASAPFVATLVDVSGLIIYFTVAAVVLRGALL